MGCSYVKGQQPSVPEDYIEVENKSADKTKGNKKKENYNTNAYNPAHFFKHIIYEASFEQDEQVY